MGELNKLRLLWLKIISGLMGYFIKPGQVERFFGSLKHDWIFKIAQPTREHMKKDVAAYMRYYNLERLHSANGDQSPINYENSLKKVSGWT